MAHPARPSERHPPNPSLGPTSRAAPPSPTTPVARRPDTPRRATQDTPWATCVDGSSDGSRNSAPSQCKQDQRPNQMHHANAATSRTKGIVEPDYSDKLKISRFSGGTYSKPEARVKLIPMEDITYAKHKKPYGRTVGAAVLQKRHCRRSVTPPPNSRKVSLVGSRSLSRSPKTSAPLYDSCLPRKRPATAKNLHPFARGHISSSVTPQITSLKDPASPSCKSSQPLSTNWNTDATPRNLDRMDSTKALPRSSSSSILHSQGQSSQKMSASLPKGAMVNLVSPSPKQMRAPHPSGDPVCTKAGPSSKSLCTPESAKLCSRNINSITRSTAAPGLQAPIVEPALLSPTSVLSERPIEVYPDTRASAPVMQEPSVKPILGSPIPVHQESSTECDNIPPIHGPQSMASAEHSALLQERNSEASINCSRSLAFCHNVGTPEILHMKLRKKHDQPEALWKGNFRVIGELLHTCDGLEAHFPLVVCVKVYEAAKNMPEILNLEAIPLSQLCPKRFKMEPPDGGDIGLWFASSHERPHRSFDHLLEKVASHTGLLTKVGDTELAIFSSLLLAPHYQRKNGELYFWGVFGKRIRKKRCQPSSHIKNVKINPSQSNEDSCNKYEKVGARLNVTKGKGSEDNESDIGMTMGARGNPTDVTENKERVRDNYEGIAKALDLTGGKETDRVNDCMAVAGTPDSNPASSCSAPAASLLNRCCSHDSTNKSTFSLEDSACQPADRSSASSDLMLDVPPGFSLDVPPGFTKAHCQLPIEAAAVSCVNAPPSLILDTPPGFPTDIPPGFTEAHHRLPAAISSAVPATRASTPLLNGCCSRDSANNKSTFTLEDSACQPADRSSARSDSMVDIPPGFSLDVPPGFTKAHCQLPIEAAAVSCANAPPSLILETPPGFPTDIPSGFTEAHHRLPAAICSAGPATRASTPLLNGCCSRDSANNKSTFRLEDSACQPADRSSARSDSMVDIPPGFSLDVPPGFTKAHCQLPIEAAAVSCANAPPSLILDTPGFPTDIPPGFTEAHRQVPAAISSAGPATRASTPGSEKKPLVRFSQNVTRPVKMEVPPGFTALHKVKKEPVLPAVNKATEKQTLYSFAPAACSMGKAGKADEMEIMDNEVKIERDDNSEEREFPKIRRLSDLYRGPSDITEFPEPAFLPDMFQEQVPEKQMHPRKRVNRESPEPSPADVTTGRPNVNGRIALNNNTDQGNGKVRCICQSSGGRALLPTGASGDHLDGESISCRCVVCGERFPSQ